MFGKQDSRRHKAERVATQAWDHLTSAVDAAGSSARSARRRVEMAYDDTSDRVGSGAKEARQRAAEAYDALMGRRRRRTAWQWLAAATLLGAAAGWVATTVGRRAASGPDLLALPESLSDEFIQTRP